MKTLKQHRLDEENKSGDSSLHDWFSKSKSSDGKPGWVQLGGRYAGKPCARQPGQTTKPKCGSSKMAANMSDKEEDAAARRKREQDPNPDRKGKPINVSTEGKRKMKESLDEYIAKGECPECGGVMISENELTEAKDACYHKVKSRYSVWPSAYASGALVKCRRVGAANWGNKTKKENVEIKSFKAFIDEACWKGYHKEGTKKMFGKTYPNCVKNEEVEQIDEISAKLVGNYYGAATKQHIKKVGIKPNMYDRIEKDMGKQRKAGVDRALDRVMGIRKTNEEVEQLDEYESKGGVYKHKGTYGTSDDDYVPPKKKDRPNQSDPDPQSSHAGAMISGRKSGEDVRGYHVSPKVMKAAYSAMRREEYEADDEPLTQEQLDEVAAWQRKEGKSEAGGLNRKGIESYRRENPGSKLSMAVTTKPSKLKPGSKAANRRKSFCARMGGMKRRLTSAKTARDPDSRINKALRKWNC